MQMVKFQAVGFLGNQPFYYETCEHSHEKKKSFLPVWTRIKEGKVGNVYVRFKFDVYQLTLHHVLNIKLSQ